MTFHDGPRTRFGRRGYSSSSSSSDGCRPSNCKAECTPTCSSSERCILNVMTECGQCPLSQCVNLSALGITSASNTSNNNDGSGSGPQVGLIAGLTTGLVAAALVVLTVAGFVYRRRRKRPHTQESTDKEQNMAMPATPLSPPPAAALPLETGWTQSNPYSPVLLGQSSLQIPRLTTSPPTPITPTSPQSTSIRRSLNIVPSSATTNIDRASSNDATTNLYRSSSVRVGKYDRMRARRLSENLDDDGEDGPVQLRRAVSVKKGQGGVGLARSTSLRSARSPEEREAAAAQITYAKPVMVRINTVTRKEGGVTRKASVRTVISERNNVPPHDSLISNPSTSDDRSARRLRQESWNSQAESSHSSIGDGEITVFWDGPRS